MIESFVRPESWINEVLRINSCFGRINEIEFGYPQLGKMPPHKKDKDKEKSYKKI